MHGPGRTRRADRAALQHGRSFTSVPRTRYARPARLRRLPDPRIAAETVAALNRGYGGWPLLYAAAMPLAPRRYYSLLFWLGLAGFFLRGVPARLRDAFGQYDRVRHRRCLGDRRAGSRVERRRLFSRRKRGT